MSEQSDAGKLLTTLAMLGGHGMTTTPPPAEGHDAVARYRLTEQQERMARAVAQKANVSVQMVRDGIHGWVEDTWIRDTEWAATLLLYSLCTYYEVREFPS